MFGMRGKHVSSRTIFGVLCYLSTITLRLTPEVFDIIERMSILHETWFAHEPFNGQGERGHDGET